MNVFTRLNKSRLPCLALVAIAIACATYFSYIWSRDASIEALREDVTARMDIYRAALFAPTDKYSYLPEVVANHSIAVDVLRNRTDPSRIANANVFLHHLNSRSGSDLIYVLDNSGQVVAASNWDSPTSLIGHNYAFRPYFIEAQTKGASKFYGIGVTTLVPGYYISHNIRQDGNVLGVAVVKVNLSNLDKGWDHGGDQFVVTDKNGVVFLSTRPEWKYRLSKPFSPAVQDMVSRTRQYGDELKGRLPLHVAEKLSANESLVEIGTGTGVNWEGDSTGYFMKSVELDGSEWTLSTLVPTTGIYARATWVAVITGGSLLLLIQSLLYLYNARARSIERNKASKELEEKHNLLLQLSEELRIASITDPLTGAFNRRFFLESAAKLVSLARRHEGSLSIVILDVDHFKHINDTHGHPAGDKVLQAITAIIKAQLREHDVLARFGGEEFIIALPHTDIDAAGAVAERLRSAIMAESVSFDATEIGITASIGVATHDSDESTIEGTIRRADAALYKAKNGGRNQVVTDASDGRAAGTARNHTDSAVPQ